MENNNKPAIRFRGFTEDWEKHKVKDIADRYDNLRVPVAANLRIPGSTPYYGANGIQDYVEGFTHEGEFVLVAEDGANDLKNYPVKCVKGRIWVNNHAHVLQGKPNLIDNRFLAYSINQADIESLLVGGSRAKLNAETLMDIVLDIPSKSEQELIGGYIANLDNLINLHQRKYEKLQNIKKSCLEKMFPQNGSDTPEIRFKGFTEGWEQRKLNEIATIVGGGTPNTNVPEYWDGDIDWYAPAEMEGQRYAVRSVRRITELGLQKSSATILPAGKTVLFTSRAGIGKMAILEHPAATNQGFQSLVLNDDYNPYFIYSMGSKIKEKAEGVASGSTFLEISGKTLGNLKIMVPSLDEQNQISEFFLHLDNLITLHQSELEKLQNIKKSCLEKMFVKVERNVL